MTKSTWKYYIHISRDARSISQRTCHMQIILRSARDAHLCRVWLADGLLQSALAFRPIAQFFRISQSMNEHCHKIQTIYKAHSALRPLVGLAIIVRSAWLSEYIPAPLTSPFTGFIDELKSLRFFMKTPTSLLHANPSVIPQADGWTQGTPLMPSEWAL